MDILNLLGLFAVVPTVLLITVSFFVMFTLSKVEKSTLRIFGLVVVGLLWIASLVVFSAGLLMVADGFDYFGDHSTGKVCKCPCYSKKASCCGMNNYSYHNKMMNPREGIMTDPHHGMLGGQSSGMENKYMNSTSNTKK